MSREVEWSPASSDDLERLDRRTQERIRQAVYRLAETNQGDVQRLHGREREWRLRVGQWRIRFAFDDEKGSILIFRVLPRGSAYRP